MDDSCLVISNDGGLSVDYDDKQNTAVAYREFLLPPGTYDLSIAWRVEGDDDKDCMYVSWAPATTKIQSSVAGMDGLVLTFAKELGKNGERYLSGQKEWHVSLSQVAVLGSGQTPQLYRLYLVWDNDEKASAGSAACVDFIQIVESECLKPEGLTFDYGNSALDVSWDVGTASKYEVMWRKFGDKNMTDNGVTTGTHSQIRDIPEGLYDVFVRSICDDDTSIWVCRNNIFCYDPSLHCIDYLDLTGPDVVCTWGDFQNPRKHIEIIDDGPDARTSIHTRMTVQGETDPRTGGQLKTIPDGALASIRLSNWTEETSPSGSISYEYEVKPDAAMLLLRYAAVLQYQAEHPSKDQTRILIRVYDEDGDLVSPCTEADFNAADVSGGNTRGWKTYDPEVDGSFEDDGIIYRSCPIKWLDWSAPLGVNLSSQVGKKVRIEIILYACVANFHFAYTYFTLDCASGALEGYSCGEQENYSAKAPDGFAYEWYRLDDPDKTVICRDRELSVPAQQADTFVCDVIYKEKSDCRFPLYAYLVPRLPVAKFTPEHKPRNCENWLLLRNSGGVMSDGALTDAKFDYIEWTVTDLSTGKATVITDSLSPELRFPDRGDTISVRLLTKLSHCDSVMEIERFVVPPIGKTDTTVVREVCSLPYIFDNKQYDTPGIYPVEYVNDAGCRSVLTLDLRYEERVDTTIYDTICMGDTCLFGERKFTTSSPAEGYLRTIDSSKGCDSVITLHLTVIDAVVAEFGQSDDVCADSSYFDIPCTFSSGEAGAYSLRFDSKALDAGFVDVDSALLTDGYLRIALPEITTRPDRYSADVLFHTSRCGDYSVPLQFTVNYPVAGIMEQKWNDAIALLNREHNYGQFEYSHYQWYRNGVAIPGADRSYLYIGEDFVETDEYRVELTRAGEQEAIMSCALSPVKRVGEAPHIAVRTLQNVRALAVEPLPAVRGVARWYTPAGLLVKESVVLPEDGLIDMPSTRGIYVLNLVFPTETLTCKVVIEE